MTPFWELPGFWGYVAGILGSGGLLWKTIEAYRNWRSGRVAEQVEKAKGLTDLLRNAQEAEAAAKADEAAADARADREAATRRIYAEALAKIRQQWIEKGHDLSELDPWPSAKK